MADPNEPLVQTCTSCGALIDVSEEEPFALMHCPTCGSGMRVRRSFHHFELQEPLGAGGMGTVYRALDTNLNRMVALKLLRKEYSADPDFVRQFQTEAATTGSINHPNVVKVYSTGEDHGLLYIAMELVDKGSLDDLMNLQGRVPEAQVLQVGMQIARGLEAALQRGLIHRDIKPGNILFADAHTAKIVDFGLAVLMEHASHGTGEVWGTPYYVAPEKLDNQPEDHRSDIYSLGASLFHALAGRPPFEAETASMVALKHVKSQAVSLQAFAPDVSSATAFVINKTLNKNPADRYQSYGELVEHLDYARNELLEKAGSGSAVKKSRVVLESEREQKAVTWITVAIIAIVVIGGVAAFILRHKPTPPDSAQETVVEQSGEKVGTIESRYRTARQLVLGGKRAEGAAALRKLDEEANIPQPLHNWITIYSGLAELLSAREKEAREIFARLEKRGVYSTDPAEKKISDFFLDLAQKMAGEAPVPVAAAKDYNRSNHEVIGLLLLALKDWELENYGEAGLLFRQFHSATPQVPKNWLGEPEEISALKSIAGDYVTDYTKWREVTDGIKSASTVEDRKAVLEKSKAARDTLRLKGKLIDFFNTTIAELEKQVATQGEEQTRKTAEQDAADAQVLGDAKAKAMMLAKQLKFPDGRVIVAGAKVSGEKGRRERDALVKRYEWLARFKSMLINDLNAAGYPAAVVRKNGATLSGGLNKADDAQVYNRTPYGSVPVLWTDLMPEAIYAVAGSFIRPGTPPEPAAERKWLLGIYAYFINRPREGRTLVTEAAQAKAEYKEALPLFLEFAERQ